MCRWLERADREVFVPGGVELKFERHGCWSSVLFLKVFLTSNNFHDPQRDVGSADGSRPFMGLGFKNFGTFWREATCCLEVMSL